MQLKLLLFLLFLSMIACKQSSKNANPKEKPLNCHHTYSKKELQEDFELLVNHLDSIHPDLYRVNPELIIRKRIQSIQSKLNDSLSYLSFLKLIAPLFTDIGCANTQWGHSKAYIQYRNEHISLFPLSFKIEESRFWVEENYSTTNLQKGDEILSINGVIAADYLEKNYPLLPIEGKVRSLQHQWLEMAFPKHHSNFWEQPEVFQLKIRTKEGVEDTITIKALLDEEIKAQKIQKPEKPLQLNWQDSTAILTIKSFNLRAIQYHNQDLQHFLDSSFSIINHKANLLLIDLRDNAWGNIEAGAMLYEYLNRSSFQYIAETKQKNFARFKNLATPPDSISIEALTQNQLPHSRHYNGKLYLLTNGWNIHAAGYFCAKIQTRKHTYFLGEQPGNTLFGVNIQPFLLQLPNTKLSIRIPSIQLIANPEKYNDVKGIKISHITEDETITKLLH